MANTILLWGLLRDEPLRRVADKLIELGSHVLFLDQQDVLQTKLNLQIDKQVRGTLQTPEFTVDLEEISAVYLRPFDVRRLPHISRAGDGSREWRHALALDDALLCWLELTSAIVVNRPLPMNANNSKPYQAQLIRECGFDTPETLITTDADAALEFWTQHRRVIYKSVSGVRSIVRCLTDADRERLVDLAACPTQFQEYIPGADYRVHVIGDEVWGCEIQSDADDYRYAARDNKETRIHNFALDDKLAERCRRMVKRMNLAIAGIDLRRTPTGHWYCFEVNPSPGYTYYQDACNQPLDSAIARLLLT